MYKTIISICIYLLIYQPSIHSLRYHLTAKNKPNVLKKILENIQNFKQNYDNSLQDNVGSKDYKIEAPQFKYNKVELVKRIIPHGYKQAGYEYDKRLNVLYKPLIRFHVKKTMADNEKQILKEIKTSYKNDASKINFENFNDDIKSRVPIVTIMILNNKKGTNEKYLRDLSSLFDKSGEKFDPLAPGADIDGEILKKKEVIKYAQDNPFWNYWTYPKTIVEDMCPDNLIQIGHSCVSINK